MLPPSVWIKHILPVHLICTEFNKMSMDKKKIRLAKQ